MTGSFDFLISGFGKQFESDKRRQGIGPKLEEMKQPPAPGSLIIADTFAPEVPGQRFAHGELSAAAARRVGFRGPIVTVEQDKVNQPKSLDDWQIGETLSDPKSTRAEILRAIDTHASSMSTELVRRQTAVVATVADSGARNTVLNISMGYTKAGASKELYDKAALAWNGETDFQRRMARPIAENYAKAFGLDIDKLTSDDPSVSGPERAKLQQALVNRASRAIDTDDGLKQARAAFQTQVRRFEAGHNSVVVSTGNEGAFEEDFKREANGQSIRVPADFEKNVLDVPEVTLVGATEPGPQGRKVARYSNRGGGEDVLAEGRVDADGDGRVDEDGTSFAAPRTGATMAKLHKLHPHLTSAQVETLMRSRLTTQIEGQPALDQQKTRSFLSGQRF